MVVVVCLFGMVADGEVCRGGGYLLWTGFKGMGLAWPS